MLRYGWLLVLHNAAMNFYFRFHTQKFFLLFFHFLCFHSFFTSLFSRVCYSSFTKIHSNALKHSIFFLLYCEINFLLKIWYSIFFFLQNFLLAKFLIRVALRFFVNVCLRPWSFLSDSKFAAKFHFYSPQRCTHWRSLRVSFWQLVLSLKA